MNDHLISNEVVVVVVVVEASGESIMIHLRSAPPVLNMWPSKRKKLDEEKSKHEVGLAQQNGLGSSIFFNT
jgi:hypothetical protein